MLRFLITVVIMALTTATYAQKAPSASEIAAYSGLHLAAHKGDVAEVRRLLAEGADPNVRDRAERTPAHVAAFASHDAVITALAEGGAEMNALEDRIYDVVTIAAVANDAELVSLAILLGNSPKLITSIYEGTALIAAAHLGHHEVVARLVESGAPLDHVNNLGWTALMEAVVLGDGGPNYVKTVKVLVDAGADKNISDRNGVTPRQHARARGYKKIVSLLE